MWSSILRQNRMSTPALQGLLYLLLVLLANLQTTFAYPQDIIIGDDARVDSISGNSGTTVSADDSSSSANDNADSSTLGGIGNQSFGVQFGGGFVVGCVIGVLGYILYRITSSCFRRRRWRRRNRIAAGTRESQVENGAEAGGP